MENILMYEQLIDAGFTPAEAKDVIAMIKEDE